MTSGHGNPAIDKKWDSIIFIHRHTKELVLRAEERDPEHEFYFPPLVQQRDTLDHIVRAEWACLHPEDLSDENRAEPEKYAILQLDKALGHAYRGFFDIADWYGLRIREEIADILEPYSRGVIARVLPEQVKTYEPRINVICDEIAAIRNGKDIGKSVLKDHVSEYVDVLNELDRILSLVRNARPDLDKAQEAASNR